MDKITETHIASLLKTVCAQNALIATYGEGSPINGRCWRVTFEKNDSLFGNVRVRSIELVGTTRRELYAKVYAFWYGMMFQKELSTGAEG